jgi:hypothetical protein
MRAWSDARTVPAGLYRAELSQQRAGVGTGRDGQGPKGAAVLGVPLRLVRAADHATGSLSAARQGDVGGGSRG